MRPLTSVKEHKTIETRFCVTIKVTKTGPKRSWRSLSWTAALQCRSPTQRCATGVARSYARGSCIPKAFFVVDDLWWRLCLHQKSSAILFCLLGIVKVGSVELEAAPNPAYQKGPLDQPAGPSRRPYCQPHLSGIAAQQTELEHILR
jgi:hypothetical protein